LSISKLTHVGLAIRLFFVAVLLTTYGSPAYAHEDAGAAGGIAAGFSHPFLGLDHMLAMIAVGIWGAFLGKPLLVMLPMVFPVMMTVGAALAMASIPFPPVELGIAVSVIVLGLLILAAKRAAPFVACSIVAVFALFHGYAHGIELPATADPVGYSVGFVLATGLLHLAGIGLGLLKSLRFGDLGLRAAGAATAAAGAMFLIAGLPR
jgi:urease accessory protein